MQNLSDVARLINASRVSGFTYLELPDSSRIRIDAMPVSGFFERSSTVPSDSSTSPTNSDSEVAVPISVLFRRLSGQVSVSTQANGGDLGALFARLR